MDTGALRQALSVLLVFFLLGLALWKLRRPGSRIRLPWRKGGSEARTLESLERLALTPQHVLHRVRVDGREVLIVTHPQGCRVVSETAKRRSPGLAAADGARV